MVENKCSKISECQNSFNDTRWIRANRLEIGQCPSISVSPEQYRVDDPTSVSNLLFRLCNTVNCRFFSTLQLTLTLTQSLPSLLDGESYLCHFDSNGVSFTVDAVGSGTNYTCNITGRIPVQFQGPSTGKYIALSCAIFCICNKKLMIQLHVHVHNSCCIF